ncbi:hypothetical protein [Actinomyces sp. SKVG-SVH-4(1)]|uniref:hypothetical protein n=1 Tax=Actinomyces sp. SKVG-SVH-4(1) TaxID=3240382 RepID=UPI003AF27894
MSHLPPQNPNRDPHIQGAGHPRNTPTPVPYGRYNPPVGQMPAAGFGWNDPVLMEVQRKRSATRTVSVAGSIIGLITMSIQVIATSSVFVAYILPPLEFVFLALLMAIAAPFVVGLGWIVTFILGLIACIRANSRTPQVQPDGWIEAKMPTSALLAASIVAGLPTLVIFLTWFWQIHRGTDTYVLYAVLVVSYLVQVLIAVGFIVLLRKSKALDPTVRAS